MRELFNYSQRQMGFRNVGNISARQRKMTKFFLDGLFVRVVLLPFWLFSSNLLGPGSGSIWLTRVQGQQKWPSFISAADNHASKKGCVCLLKMFNFMKKGVWTENFTFFPSQKKFQYIQRGVPRDFFNFWRFWRPLYNLSHCLNRTTSLTYLTKSAKIGSIRGKVCCLHLMKHRRKHKEAFEQRKHLNRDFYLAFH